MPTKEEIAAGRLEDVLPQAAPPAPQAGAPEVDPRNIESSVLPQTVKSVNLPKVQATKRYLKHREAANSPAAEIAALEKELGLDKDEPVPQDAPLTEQDKTPTLMQRVLGGVKDAAQGGTAGVINGVQEFGDAVLDVADWWNRTNLSTANPAFAGAARAITMGAEAMGAGAAERDTAESMGTMTVGVPDSTSGRLAEGLGRFAVGFLPTNRAMQGAKLIQAGRGMRIVKAAASGAITDFAFFDPHTERLSNLVQEHPMIANPLTDYLAAKPGDSAAEGRLKNTLEGLGVGAALDGALGAFKAYKNWMRYDGRQAVVDVIEADAKAATAGGPATNPVTARGAPVAEAGTATSPATKGSISDSDRALQDSIRLREQNAQAAAEVNRGVNDFFDEAMGTGAKAEPRSDKLFHGTAAEFEKLDPAKSGGMVSFTADEAKAWDYAGAGGGQRVNQGADARYWVDDVTQTVYEAEGRGLKPVGTVKNGMDIIRKENIEPLKGPAESLDELAVERLRDEGRLIKGGNKNARVIESNFNGLNVVNTEERSGLEALAALNPQSAVGKQIVAAAQKGLTEGGERSAGLLVGEQIWTATRQGQKFAKELEQDIIGPLRAKGFDGIRHYDDGGFTHSLWDSGLAKVQGSPAAEEAFATVVPKADISAAGITNPAVADALPEGRAININLEKVDASTDVRAVIANIAQAFEPSMQANRGYQPDELVKQLAESLDMTAADLAARQSGEAYTAAQLLAARGLVNAGANKLVELAQAATRVGATDAERAAFLRAIEGQRMIQAKLTGAIAESGRALRAARIPVGIPETAARAEAVNRMMVELSGRESVEEMARIFSDIREPRVVARILRQSMARRMSDVVHYTWINGILGGARTVAVNVVGNSLAIAQRGIETQVAEVLGQLKPGALAGLNRDRIVVGEAKAMFSGFADTFMDSYRQARDFFRGRTPIGEFSPVSVARRNPITKENFDLTGAAGKAVDYLGVAIGLPTRLAGTADRFAKTFNYRMSLNQFAHREATLQGLIGQEREAFIKATVLDPPDDLMYRAMDDADLYTFNNELPDIAEKLIQIAHDPETAAGQVVRYVVPFLRTNLNIAGYGLQRMPILNRLSPRMRADIAAGGARADLAKAKVAFGSTMMATASYFASQGTVTGGGPSDYKARQALESTGWRPYSVRVGDTYYQINRLDPYGKLLGMAADFTEIAGKVNNGDLDLDDAALLAVDAVLNSMNTERMVESMVDFGKLVMDVKGEAPKYFSNLGASFAPNWLAQFARAGGEVKRDTSSPEFKIKEALGKYDSNNSYFEETMNKIKARIPGYGADLPARRNLFGEPEVYDKGWGADMGIPVIGAAADLLSPVMVSKVKDSPARAEIARLALEGREFSLPKEYIPTDQGAVPLNPKEYEKFSELSAGIGLYKAMLSKGAGNAENYKRTLEEELNYQIKNDFPTFGGTKEQKKLDENRYGMITSIINSYRKMAGIALGADPAGSEIPKRYEKLYKVKAKNVTGQPIGPGGTR